jgi:hypothetical protein
VPHVRYARLVQGAPHEVFTPLEAHLRRKGVRYTKRRRHLHDRLKVVVADAEHSVKRILSVLALERGDESRHIIRFEREHPRSMRQHWVRRAVRRSGIVIGTARDQGVAMSGGQDGLRQNSTRTADPALNHQHVTH